MKLFAGQEQRHGPETDSWTQQGRRGWDELRE